MCDCSCLIRTLKKENDDFFGIGSHTLCRWGTQLNQEGYLNRKLHYPSIRKLPIPPSSPELNLIERFWVSLKRTVVELLW